MMIKKKQEFVSYRMLCNVCNVVVVVVVAGSHMFMTDLHIEREKKKKKVYEKNETKRKSMETIN